MVETKEHWQYINELGRRRTPFLLLADFELKQIKVWPLSSIDPSELAFRFPQHKNTKSPLSAPFDLNDWVPKYPAQQIYEKAFARVQKGLHRGDSFLLNLTFPTHIETDASLRDIFQHTSAKYQLWWKNHFTFFSPETFVTITDGTISSFPMKGTLEAHLPLDILLNSKKEQAEHATIVDLIRNDLSQVAKGVHVERYRYAEKVATTNGALWQTSSVVRGNLPRDFHKQLGSILQQLLPAGSISGAPKPATINLIRQAEEQDRGYYTGIAAIWDGFNLDSCVMIRFVEHNDGNLRYWSGGGITANSEALQEYEELKAKVYLPL